MDWTWASSMVELGHLLSKHSSLVGFCCRCWLPADAGAISCRQIEMGELRNVFLLSQSSASESLGHGGGSGGK